MKKIIHPNKTIEYVDTEEEKESKKKYKTKKARAIVVGENIAYNYDNDGLQFISPPTRGDAAQADILPYQAGFGIAEVLNHQRHKLVSFPSPLIRKRTKTQRPPPLFKKVLFFKSYHLFSFKSLVLKVVRFCISLERAATII